MTRWRAPGAALVLLCAACSPHGAGGQAELTPGARLYLTYCAACHQANGSGVAGVQPPLAGTPVTVGDPQVLLAWVMFGVRPAALPRGVYHGVMPQFGYLSDADLAALVTHVRTSFGNRAPPVPAPLVAAVRARPR